MLSSTVMFYVVRVYAELDEVTSFILDLFAVLWQSMVRLQIM